MDKKEPLENDTRVLGRLQCIIKFHANGVERKIKEIGIFGSYVHGAEEPDSDLDILVDFEEYPSLFEFMGIEQELSDRIGVKVDLVMKSGLKPRIGKRILQEVIYL